MPYANNKGAARLACASAQSDQCLCCSLPGQYNTSTNSRNFKTQLVSSAEQVGLSLTWSKLQKTGFLVTRLIFCSCMLFTCNYRQEGLPCDLFQPFHVGLFQKNALAHDDVDGNICNCCNNKESIQ